MNIDQRINYKMMKILRDYNLTWVYFDLRANDLVPSSLKYGGYRNTCYDFRR